MVDFGQSITQSLKNRLKSDCTNAVVRKIQGDWLKASSAWAEQFPNYFAEQDNGHVSVSLHSKTKRRKNNTAYYSINEKNYHCDTSVPQKSPHSQFNTNY